MDAGAPMDTVLVVDDDPGVRWLFRDALTNAGLDVVEAADGREALGIIATRPIGVMLLDEAMPHLGGLDVLRMVRAQESTRTLPVIIVTARGDEDDRVRGLAAGANDYLAKPVSIRELVARVRAQLRGRTAWSSAIDSALKERRALSRAVRHLFRPADLRDGADAMLTELGAAVGYASTALLRADLRKSFAPLASRGGFRTLYPTDGRLGPAEGRRLRDRAGQGPWVEELTGPEAERSGLVAMCAVPIHSGQQLGGLLLVGATSGETPYPVESLTQLLPLLVELSEQIGGLIGPDVVELTAREREVVAALQEGRSYRDVAAHLHLSEGTVRTLVQRAYRKLGISSRYELPRA